MRKIDITLGDAPEADIVKIVGDLRPNWVREEIIIKTLSGGNVNRMYMCSLKDDIDENDKVVVRVYRDVGDRISNTNKDVIGMRIGHLIGIAPKVFCTFNNGMVYHYEKGCHVNFEEQKDETFSREVAKGLAKVHQVDYRKVLEVLGEGDKIDLYKACFRFSSILSNFLTAVPEKYDDEERELVRREELMAKDAVLDELRRLNAVTESMQFPLVFGHNDPNTCNLVFNKQTGRVHFVDWEFADLSDAVTDIGIFFFSHSSRFGVKPDPSHLKLYPNMEYQCKWVRWYLEYKADLSGENPRNVTDDEVIRFCKGANLAAMCFALVVSQWCLFHDAMCPKLTLQFESARYLQSLYRMLKGKQDAVN